MMDLNGIIAFPVAPLFTVILSLVLQISYHFPKSFPVNFQLDCGSVGLDLYECPNIEYCGKRYLKLFNTV